MKKRSDIMNSLMEYKGYHAKIEYSAEDEAFIGTVCWINDSIAFDGESIKELTQAFHDSIDDYLSFCKEIGKEPNKEFKGMFNVRMDSDLHRAATIAATQKGITLNQFVVDAVKSSLANPQHSQEKRINSLERSVAQLWLKHETNASIWHGNVQKHQVSMPNPVTRRYSNATT